MADHSRCWAEGKQAGVDACLELEQSNVSAFPMLLLTSVGGRIISVSTHGGLRVLGRLDVRAQKLVWVSWRRCVGTVGRSGVAEGEPARAGGKKPAPALLSLRERQKLQSSGSVLTLLSSGNFAQ